MSAGGFSGFATFGFSAGAANDSAIRGEDERVGQRWSLFFLAFFAQERITKPQREERRKQLRCLLPLLIFCCLQSSPAPQQMRDSVSSDERFKRSPGDRCGLKDGLPDSPPHTPHPPVRPAPFFSPSSSRSQEYPCMQKGDLFLFVHVRLRYGSGSYCPLSPCRARGGGQREKKKR